MSLYLITIKRHLNTFTVSRHVIIKSYVELELNTIMVFTLKGQEQVTWNSRLVAAGLKAMISQWVPQTVVMQLSSQ